jgi:hypothetical protein
MSEPVVSPGRPTARARQVAAGCSARREQAPASARCSLRNMKRVRLVVLAAVAALVLTATANAMNPVHATMRTTSTQPLVDTPWSYTIVVKDRSGKPLAARVRLQILLGTLVVGCWKQLAIVQCSGANTGTWIPFKGKRTGVITWPAQSAGVKLTFQATVVAAGRALKLRAPVTVKLP